MKSLIFKAFKRSIIESIEKQNPKNRKTNIKKFSKTPQSQNSKNTTGWRHKHNKLVHGAPERSITKIGHTNAKMRCQQGLTKTKAHIRRHLVQN